MWTLPPSGGGHAGLVELHDLLDAGLYDMAEEVPGTIEVQQVGSPEEVQCSSRSESEDESKTFPCIEKNVMGQTSNNNNIERSTRVISLHLML